MKKVCVIGHFGIGKNMLNGQTVKTKIVTDALTEEFGADQVLIIDTHGGIKNVIKAPFHVIKALKVASNIVIFPAQNGVKIYVPLLLLFRFFFRDRKLHYVVIGGWLPMFVLNRKWLTNSLKRFDGIYVETRTMQQALEKQAFTNVYVMKNCKKLKCLSAEEMSCPLREPVRFCIFSRVMKEKGIEDAVEALKAVSGKGYAVSLDIYGQIDNEQKDWFEKLCQSFPSYVVYKGQVPADKSVETLKGYYALLFPTKFYTEGIPGTVIDAYAAGIPVICSRWESFSDVVLEGKTGYGYNFESTMELVKTIEMLIEKNDEEIMELKRNCVKEASNYSPEVSISSLVKRFR